MLLREAIKKPLGELRPPLRSMTRGLAIIHKNSSFVYTITTIPSGEGYTCKSLSTSNQLLKKQVGVAY